jgi:glycosyltransferase involved in cell wall biosynthesis
MMINQLQKEDPRIIIINNKKRMGTLYSRSIGALAAKGKYLFPLDNDDMFLDTDVFKYIYYEANNNNYDIVKFRGLWARGIENFMLKKVKTKVFMNHKIGLILHQPELSYFPIRKNEDYFVDVFLWGKCIKSEIYKSAINLYGEKNYSEFIIGWEDGIINFIICQIANSFKFIGKYGVFNIISEKSSYFKTLNTDNNMYEIKFLQSVFNFSKDSYRGKEIIVYLVTTLLHRKLFKKTLENKDLEKLFNSIFKKIMECPYICENDKNIMKDTYISVLKKNLFNNFTSI